MARTYQPLGNRVLVRPVTAEEVTRSGLVVPDTAKERPQEGEVLAIGPGKLTEDGKRQPMEVTVGDHVLLAKFAGTEVKGDQSEEEELLVLREDDILAVIRNGK